MENLMEVTAIWRKADAVTFDVDSTVTRDEGIDELAKFCGEERRVAALTQQAMLGSITFQESLKARLNIIRPSLTNIKEFLSSHSPQLSPGIESLIAALHLRKKQVFLISGGFHCLITPVAQRLNISYKNIHANRLKFYFTGEYAGFDESEPTATTGGKAEVIRRLKEETGFRTIVHIGDGATDLETVPPADLFIGYGGNVVRDTVKSRALWFVTDFAQLEEAL